MSKKVGVLVGMDSHAMPCKAILRIHPGCLLGHISKEIKAYCKIESTTCQRTQLLTHFNVFPTSDRTKCCDVCSGPDENYDLFNPRVQQVSEIALIDDSDDDCFVAPEHRALIKEKLTELRSHIVLCSRVKYSPLHWIGSCHWPAHIPYR